MTNSTAARRRRWLSSLAAGLRLFVHSNLFISLAAASVVITTVVLTGLPFDPVPFFIVFAVTLFVYTVNRFTDLEEDEENVPERAAFIKRYGRYWLAIGATLYLATVGAAVVYSLPGAGFLLIPPVVAVVYSLGGIKRVFLVKNLFVGLAWGLIPLGVGVYYGHLWTTEILFLAAYVGAMITIAAIIFDIKDIVGDRAEGIPTVPTRYGPRWTRIVAQVANLLVAAVVVGLVTAGTLPGAFLALLAFHGYIGCYIPFASRGRGPLFYGFVVDGEHIFLAGVVLALEWLIW
ncbi:prenyltransferase [Natronococcus pandeyae]|uniref:Prenyltransferase n=1 Tax=Natronococcus pandeyae TaxID=2055836 RepID=A0A8J8Q2X6_9EURY|nr:UbiA family prenyltransferase [Natronococcus pandeyae]TYL36150.1 prenyltransferase [Natronococcus pandeyae]